MEWIPHACLPELVQISRCWLCSIKFCEVWMEKKEFRMVFHVGVTLFTVFLLGFKVYPISNIGKYIGKVYWSTSCGIFFCLFILRFLIIILNLFLGKSLKVESFSVFSSFLNSFNVIDNWLHERGALYLPTVIFPSVEILQVFDRQSRMQRLWIVVNFPRPW